MRLPLPWVSTRLRVGGRDRRVPRACGRIPASNGRLAGFTYNRAMRARVRFEPSGRTVEVEKGTLLLEAAREAGLPVARACGASGLCARCALSIVDGDGALVAASDDETRAKRRNRVSDALRLACKTTVEGDLVVTADYW